MHVFGANGCVPICVVQRVSLRSQDFILVHADILCVCRAHCNSVICDLAAGYLEAFVSAGFRGSQPELEGNRNVLNATKQAPAPQAPKILGRASHQRRRVLCGRVVTSWGSKEGASSALPLRGPIPSALQIFGAGCWLLVARGWLLVAGWGSRKPGEGEGPPRPQAPCALPRTPPWRWVAAGCWRWCLCLWMCVGLCI